MKYSQAAKFLGASRSKSEVANFFLAPHHHPDLVMSLLIAKSRQKARPAAEGGAGPSKGLRTPIKTSPTSAVGPGTVSPGGFWMGTGAHRAAGLSLRYFLFLSMFMFLSCAVAPNHAISYPGSKGVIVQAEDEEQAVEPIGKALEAAWHAGRISLSGHSLPEPLAKSFFGRLFKGRWAGLFLIDQDGDLRALARPSAYSAVFDWMKRYIDLEEENRILRDSLEALKMSQDSKKIYLEINLADNLLFVKMGSQVLYKFPVVTGRGYTSRESGRRRYFSTPRGILKVIKKERNPVWYPPSWHWTERGEEVPEERPALWGVLGKYRLNLGNAYGIHGTYSGRIRPGKYSHGCIRMNRKDLKITFKLCDVGTEVYIY